MALFLFMAYFSTTNAKDCSEQLIDLPGGMKNKKDVLKEEQI